jgi:hypothetical protein
MGDGKQYTFDQMIMVSPRNFFMKSVRPVFHRCMVASILALASTSGVAAGVVPDGASSQLLVGSFPGNEASEVVVDLYNASGISAFEFELPVPAGTTVNTTKCLESLPSTHTGQCVYQSTRNQVLVIVYSLNNDALPAGWSSIGQMTYQGPLTKGFTARNIVAADPGGVSVAVKVQSRVDVHWRNAK